MANQKILIVDDELELTDLMRMRLESHGYEVLYLNTGKDAMKVVQENKPDLVILDVQLPDVNGYDICNDLKHNSDTASIPIIIFTAKPEWKKEMDSLGRLVKADDCISKPFESEVLFSKIKNLLEKQKVD